MNTITIEPKRTGQVVSRQTIQGIVDAIAKHFSPEKIVLFGSYASGQPDPDSDVDLLVVMKTSMPRHRRAAPIRLLFRPTPCPMDILVFTPEEVDYWNGTVNYIVMEALETGSVEYERAA